MATRFIHISRASRGSTARTRSGDAITAIPMTRGGVNPATVVVLRQAQDEGLSRKVLSRRVSITMATEFCVAAVEEALAKHGTEDIFNTAKVADSPAPRSPAG